jgi:sodium-dependent dicarboxylate transporter 2/3/5
MLLIIWALLSAMFLRGRKPLQVDASIFREEYRKLGRMGFEEKVVLIDFAVLALLWLTRADIRIGEFTLPGWSSLFENPGYLNDGVVAIAMAVLLFIIPAKRDGAATIMDWETASRLPWNIILLFGGGFALAKGFTVSGLSTWVGEQLQGVGELHPILLIFVICILISFLTELTSNTATTEMILPVLAGLSVAIDVNPLLLMVPATLSCSCAFMLPVATPPNAIIFGTQRLRVSTMAKAGVALNFIGAILITLATYLWGRFVLGIELGVMPDWAQLG